MAARSLSPSAVSALCGLALASALLFGFLEAVQAAVLRWVPHVRPFDKVSLDVFWTAPLVYAAVNLPILAGFAVMSRAGLTRPLVLAPYAFAFVGAYGALSYSGLLARIACVLLALGVAVQLGRRIGRGSLTPVIRGAVALGIVALSAGAAMRIGEWWSVRPMGAGPANAGAARPSVLLVVMDTVRADRLSAYGSTRSKTPSVDSLAREGTLFERAYATSSWTLPSHASMLTGLAGPMHGAEGPNDVLRGDHPQLQQVLAAQGYATGAFVSNSVFFVPERGFGTGFHAFDVYSTRTLMARSSFGLQLTQPMRRFDIDLAPFRGAADINEGFLAWLGSIGGRPFFAVLNYMDAHEPYDSGTSRPDLRVWDRRSRRSAEDNLHLAAAYDQAVTALDAEIGRLLGALRDHPGWKHMLVIVTSDHGEAIADGSFDHGFDLTLEQIHVPLIVRMPGQVPAGQRVRTPVSLVDLAATTQALIADRGPRLPGRPLSRWFEPRAGAGDAEVRADLFEVNASKAPRRLESVVSEEYQFIRDRSTGKRRLFNARSDIAGQHDLAGDPGYVDVLQRFDATVRESRRHHQ